MLAATGMEYREHPAPGVAEHTGAGVYYGAATTEAPAFSDRRVLVVGGGNSAGQARDVSRALREGGADRRAPRVPARHDVALPDRADREDAEHPAADPDGARARRRGRPRRARRAARSTTARAEVEEIDAVFVFIGTRPRSDWLPAGVLRDDKGFVLTGRDLMADASFARIWKERREPMALETSVPGVFAAGDIRAGAMNRVASAVGEGSMVVRFVHEYLALT